MVAYKMYQSYVLPKLLYGVELMPLNKTQLSQISRFHIANLRRFQSLPSRSASAVVYLLLGALPIEAEIHKRQLSLLYNILSCDNDTISRLLERQIVMQNQNMESFFGRVTETLAFYELPNIEILKENLPSKLSWKHQYKQSKLETWSRTLQADLSEKSSVKYLNKKVLKLGQTHQIWSSLDSTVSAVRKGITKCRMLTGTFLTEQDKHKFSKGDIGSICKLCAVESEDLPHILLKCSALYETRKEYYLKIRSEILKFIGEERLEAHFNDKASIMKIIMDCSHFDYLFDKKQLRLLYQMSAEFCHQMYLNRLQRLRLTS